MIFVDRGQHIETRVGLDRGFVPAPLVQQDPAKRPFDIIDQAGKLVFGRIINGLARQGLGLDPYGLGRQRLEVNSLKAI